MLRAELDIHNLVFFFLPLPPPPGSPSPSDPGLWPPSPCRTLSLGLMKNNSKNKILSEQPKCGPQRTPENSTAFLQQHRKRTRPSSLCPEKSQTCLRDELPSVHIVHVNIYNVNVT